MAGVKSNSRKITTSARRLVADQPILFKPGGNPPGRKGLFVHYVDGHTDIAHVRLATDPYDVCVNTDYIEPIIKERTAMATATAKPTAKVLRREAKALGVEGWEDMDLETLHEAVEEAKAEDAAPKRTAAKKAPAKRAAVVEEDDEDEEDEPDDDEDEDEEEETPAPAKAAAKKAPAKKAAPAKATAKAAAKPAAKATTKAKTTTTRAEDPDLPENGNPFQQGTNLYWMTEELIKGGKRTVMVKRLSKKITLKPRTREFTEEEALKELDRRLVICSQVLRNEHGFEMEREGRGEETVIRLWKE